MTARSPTPTPESFREFAFFTRYVRGTLGWRGAIIWNRNRLSSIGIASLRLENKKPDNDA